MREPPEGLRSASYDQRRPLIPATRYRLLKLLKEDPGLSRRDLAGKFDISLGKANYYVWAFVNHGWGKMASFGRSDNRAAYIKLVPTDINKEARVPVPRPATRRT